MGMKLKTLEIICSNIISNFCKEEIQKKDHGKSLVHESRWTCKNNFSLIGKSRIMELCYSRF